MFVTELANMLEQVQPSPLFFPEFPFIVNLNSVKHIDLSWSVLLDIQLSNQQPFFLMFIPFPGRRVSNCLLG